MKLLQITTEQKQLISGIRKLAQKHNVELQEWDVKPQNPSPSNDPYYDNPKNIASIMRGIKQIKEGKGVKVSQEQIKELLGL